MTALLRQTAHELVRIRRSRSFQLGVAAVLVYLGLMVWGFMTADFDHLERTGRAMGFEDPMSLRNGPLYALFALTVAFSVLIPPFVTMVGGTAIAGEASRGTLRYVLARPVTRLRVLIIKYLAVRAYTAGLLVFFYLAGLGVGYAFFGSGDMLLYQATTLSPEGDFLVPQGEAWARLALFCLLAWFAAAVPAALAVLCSTLTDLPVLATVGSLTLYFICTIVGGIDFFEDLRPYLFTTRMLVWREAFIQDLDWVSMARSVAWCAAYTLSFLAAAWAVFESREITS